ncbi:unnamed protein product, partial [Brenthis ino]
MCPNNTDILQYLFGNDIDTMSPYATVFAYFGLYFLFMLVFFILLCIICVLVLLWYHRKRGLDCELPEDTPIKRYTDQPSSSRATNSL